MIKSKQLPDNDSVSLHIKKHFVIVRDSSSIFIHHNKTCSSKCDSVIEDIIKYLQSEMFVGEVFTVLEVKK